MRTRLIQTMAVDTWSAMYLPISMIYSDLMLMVCISNSSLSPPEDIPTWDGYADTICRWSETIIDHAWDNKLRVPVKYTDKVLIILLRGSIDASINESMARERVCCLQTTFSKIRSSLPTYTNFRLTGFLSSSPSQLLCFVAHYESFCALGKVWSDRRDHKVHQKHLQGIKIVVLRCRASNWIEVRGMMDDRLPVFPPRMARGPESDLLTLMRTEAQLRN